MNGESSMDAYLLPRVKQIANGNLLSDLENTNWGFVTTQKGGKGGRREAGARGKVNNDLMDTEVILCLMKKIYMQMVLIDCDYRKLYETFLIPKNYEKNKYNVPLSCV